MYKDSFAKPFECNLQDTSYVLCWDEAFLGTSLNFSLLIATHGYSCRSNAIRTSAQPPCAANHVAVYAHASATSGLRHHFPPFLTCRDPCAANRILMDRWTTMARYCKILKVSSLCKCISKDEWGGLWSEDGEIVLHVFLIPWTKCYANEA